MISLLLAASIATDPPLDVHRTADSATCEAVSVDQVPVGIDLGSPPDAYAFSLRWATRAEALGNPEHPEELASLYQQRVFAVFGDAAAYRGVVLMTGDSPFDWPLRRHIDARADRRFSLAGHDLATGATLTVYPDDGEFLLTVPQDASGEPEIGVLIVRGVCDFAWSEGDQTGSAER
jgi:hypothetical protein